MPSTGIYLSLSDLLYTILTWVTLVVLFMSICFHLRLLFDVRYKTYLSLKYPKMLEEVTSITFVALAQ